MHKTISCFFFSLLIVECGRTFQESSGNFSYNLSNTNGTAVKCEWRITATHGERIELNITEVDIVKSDQCSTDYLEVRDGYWHKSRLIGWSSTKRSSTLSARNVFHLAKFQVDSAVTVELTS